MIDKIHIYDCEVFEQDWVFVFKELKTGTYTIIHNDNDAVREFMQQNPILGGFNNKHYDNHILKAVMMDCEPEIVKGVNDAIIVEGIKGWEIPLLQESRVYFNSFDLMDDCQQGLSLKAIEAHLGIPIEETEVDFNINRKLTKEELNRTIHYCKYDVDATEILYGLRKSYLQNKINIGAKIGLEPERSMFMTNAKLTATYLKAKKPYQPWTDEREYKYPDKLLKEYIPKEVFDFFNRMYDPDLTDEQVFESKLNINIGECEVTLGYGGIHGCIKNLSWKAGEDEYSVKMVRNYDVSSYYPHLMTLYGYTSRNISSPEVFSQVLEERIIAKKVGDIVKANALKLVVNTTYGASLSKFNDLYDPLMGRSVCITGQLFLLELCEHLHKDIPGLRIFQCNTDGVMIEYDDSHNAEVQEIINEWQDRTGFELEEDKIQKIVQKDVNNYIEVPENADTPKIKGGQLVRGISKAGAFNINNNTVIISKAILDYFTKDKPVEETVKESTNILDFQLIAKASHKYSRVWQWIAGEKVALQRVNRVYAAKDTRQGTLYKTHAKTGLDAKMAGLPKHCVIDNNNELSIEVIDRQWYIKQAKKYINDFLGLKPPRKNTRKINSLKKKILAMLENL